MPEYRAAVVVFCAVAAATEAEARSIAEDAVKSAIRWSSTESGQISTPSHRGSDHRAATVHGVRELANASYGGYLGVEVTDRAYPREEHPDA